MKNMKLKLVFAAMVFAPLISAAQSPADALFDKYSQMDGYTSVYITQNMFSLFADIDTEADETGFLDLVKNLNCIKIITADQDSGTVIPTTNFYHEISKNFPAGKYEDLMIVKQKDQDIKFMIRKEEKNIKELLMIVGGKDENAMISIQGDIDLRTISKLSKAMKIEGMENLEKLDEKEQH
jgi:hypothetical protein